MNNLIIIQLSNAIKTLKLTEEIKIDFTKVKQSFNNMAKSIHPDKNNGQDIGFESILNAYRLLDYYFNVFLTGKNCHDCFIEFLYKISDNSRTINLSNQNQQVKSDSNINNKNQTEMVNVCSNKLNFTKNHRNCKIENLESEEFCKIHYKNTHTQKFYSNIFKNDIIKLENINYIQCRCEQLIIIPQNILALGIKTFDCDVCSCSYNISESI